MEEEILLEVNNLHAVFETYAGVVKALDGISFSIRKGETFGLVGETGCGKSVTANCIIRLIPQPPGKIESGHILFAVPPDVLARIKALKERYRELDADKGPHASQGDMNSIENELRSIYNEWDLLWKPKEYMERIRGKQISMIFQEPMSALNPVFTAGDQIAEIMLVHEKAELAEVVLQKIDHNIMSLKEYVRVEGRTVNGPGTGEIQCSKCFTIVNEGAEHCPHCGGFFVRVPFRSLINARLRFYRQFYERMKEDPNAFSLRIMSKIPILRRYERLVKDEALIKAEEMLNLVRIPDANNVLKSYPFELSGGMQQRVMIAMALACRPRLLIADEPTTALDVTIQAQILKLMKDVQEKTGTSILLITHNLGVVAETCQRVGVMYAGIVAEVAPVDEIFAEPLHPYTQGLINSIPRMDSNIERLEVIEGNVPNLIKPPSGCRFNPRCPYTMDICKEVKPPNIEVKPGHQVCCHLYTGVSK